MSSIYRLCCKSKTKSEEIDIFENKLNKSIELVYRIYMYNYYEIFSPSFLVYSVLFPGCFMNLNKK